jgi:hypothetical protein
VLSASALGNAAGVYPDPPEFLKSSFFEESSMALTLRNHRGSPFFSKKNEDSRGSRQPP